MTNRPLMNARRVALVAAVAAAILAGWAVYGWLHLPPDLAATIDDSTADGGLMTPDEMDAYFAAHPKFAARVRTEGLRLAELYRDRLAE